MRKAHPGFVPPDYKPAQSSPPRTGLMTPTQVTALEAATTKLATLYDPLTYGTQVVTDFNTIQKSGFYDGVNATGAPLPTVWFHVIHHSHAYDPNYATQFAFQLAGDALGDTRVWRRSKDGATWSAWRAETYHETAYAAVGNYGTNWRAYTGGSQFAPQYWRDNAGVVHLEGRVEKTAALGTPETVFTLPAGFRPSGTRTLHARASGGAAELQVSSAGVVQLQSGYAGAPNTWLALDLLHWKAVN